jgi:hypothetical protein
VASGHPSLTIEYSSSYGSPLISRQRYRVGAAF